MKKYLFIILGIVSLVLGCVGIFLPVLPTTPFLLLSAYLFGKSSQKLHRFIIENRYFGKYIRDYQEKKGITLKNKIIALTFLTVTMAFSIYKSPNTHMQIFLVVVFLGVSYHITKLKTLKN